MSTSKPRDTTDAAIVVASSGHNDNQACSVSATRDHSQAASASPMSDSAPTLALHTAPTSATPALSGHKRANEAAASSTAAAASSSANSPPAVSQSVEPNSKKLRGESAAAQSDVSAASASVGLDPVPSATAAASSSPLSSLVNTSNADLAAYIKGRNDAYATMNSLSHWARRLIEGALPFAEADQKRYKECLSIGIDDERAEAKEELVDILAMPDEEQAPLAERKQVLHRQIARLDRKEESIAQDYERGLSVIQEAREQNYEVNLGCVPICVLRLERLCFLILDTQLCMPLPPPQQQQAFRRWLLRVDALYTRLAQALPQLRAMDGEPEDYEYLMRSSLLIDALQLAPVAAREAFNCFEEGFSCPFIGDEPILMYFCSTPPAHVVRLQPYLRLFECGLDPTLNSEEDDSPSALQLARNFVRDHPAPPTVDAVTLVMESAIAEDLSCASEAQPVPLSILPALAMQQRFDDEEEEQLRRQDLRARFMHAFIPAWRAHSDKVRALLLSASPSSLIPDLALIVARDLDLEGLPPEPAASVPMDEEVKDQQ